MGHKELITSEGHLIKMWTQGIEVEASAQQQLYNVSKMPFIHNHIAVMPDCHYGNGATVGSVIATVNAIIPAAVGVDLGCGMQATLTTLMSRDLPDSLKQMRLQIEKSTPVGNNDFGSDYTGEAGNRWQNLKQTHDWIEDRYPEIRIRRNTIGQLGTLGGGNHFIELCIDELERVWIVLHSGSRGIGNAIGTYFLNAAKEEMERQHITNLPDKQLAYLSEIEDNKALFDDYVTCVEWAQDDAA